MSFMVGLVKIRGRRRDVRVPCRILQCLELHATVRMIGQHAVAQPVG